MHVLITRPEPDASAWRARLERAGIAVSIDPMLQIIEAPSAPIDRYGVQALIVTSRNALRWLSRCPNLVEVTPLPIFTVGPGSSEAAGTLGFQVVSQGAGRASDLPAVITTTCTAVGGRLLHLSGDKIAFDLATVLEPLGYRLDRRIVYRSCPADRLRPETAAAIASGAVDTVALLSPLSAESFTTAVAAAGLAEHHQRLVYVCLSENIAQQMRALAPAGLVVAPSPDAAAVLQTIEMLAARRAAC